MFGMDVYTARPTRTYCVAYRTLLNVMWQLGWEGSLGRMSTCIFMAEPLCYSPKTITTFIVNQLYPNTK